MSLVIKKYLGDKHCPICYGPIDILDYDRNIYYKEFLQERYCNFGCQSDDLHYKIFLIHWSENPRIEYDIVRFEQGNYQYQIFQRYYTNKNIKSELTHIEVLKLPNLELDKKLSISLNQNVFDFNNFDNKNFAHKLQILHTFQ